MPPMWEMREDLLLTSWRTVRVRRRRDGGRRRRKRRRVKGLNRKETSKVGQTVASNILFFCETVKVRILKFAPLLL